MRQCAVLFACGVLFATSKPPQDEAFMGRVHVKKSLDSWWDCELDIEIPADGEAGARLKCEYASGPFERHIPLDAQQVARLRELLRQANLFDGQFWGKDLRGWDGPLETVTVTDGDKIATLVCTGNDSFDYGSRGELVRFLDDLRDFLENQKAQ